MFFLFIFKQGVKYHYAGEKESDHIFLLRLPKPLLTVKSTSQYSLKIFFRPSYWQQ